VTFGDAWHMIQAIGALLSGIAALYSVHNGAKIKLLRHEVNSTLTDSLTRERASGKAEGVLEEKDRNSDGF
jgi:hypothetical protein